MFQRQPRSFFEEHFVASLEAADRLGDGDGCLTADEHPDHASFLEVLGNASGGRACLSDAHRLLESRLFDESMQNATGAYQDVLRAALKAKSDICLKVRATILELEALLKAEAEYHQHHVVARSINPTVDSKAAEEDAQNTLDGLRRDLRGLYADELRCRKCVEMEEGEGRGDMRLCLEEFLEDQGLLVESVGGVGGTGSGRTAGGPAESSLAETGRALWGWPWFPPSPPVAQGCVYGRADTCPLQFQHVPLLGTHNSGAYPPMSSDTCPNMRQECRQWGTERVQGCTSHKRECVDWTEHVTEECTEWSSECSSWGARHCGWFSIFCGWFCQATRQVCSATRRVVSYSCARYEDVCQAPFNFIRYLSCDATEWVCEGGIDASGATMCIWENQDHGISNQFSQGARAFDFDTCLQDGELWNCHPGAIRGVGRSKVEQDLQVIKELLEHNPGEVIYMRWSDLDPAGQKDHIRNLQEALLTQVFGPKVHDDGRWNQHNGQLGWTSIVSKTLQAMKDANVRLVVEAPGTVWDSWGDAVTGATVGEIIAHQSSFCNQRSAGSTVRLSVFAKFVASIGWAEVQDGTLPCPNGDTGRTEACPGLTGLRRTLQAHSDGTLVERSSLCNRKNAEAVNQALMHQMDGMVRACRDRDVNVGHVLVDYIGIESAGLRSGISRAIDEIVSKFGAR